MLDQVRCSSCRTVSAAVVVRASGGTCPCCSVRLQPRQPVSGRDYTVARAMRLLAANSPKGATRVAKTR